MNTVLFVNATIGFSENLFLVNIYNDLLFSVYQLQIDEETSRNMNCTALNIYLFLQKCASV